MTPEEIDRARLTAEQTGWIDGRSRAMAEVVIRLLEERHILLGALRQLIEDDVYLSDKHLAPVRAALAKAEGRSGNAHEVRPQGLPVGCHPGCAGGSEES